MMKNLKWKHKKVKNTHGKQYPFTLNTTAG
jgi:hypothetical protein